jgi:hypothetical protein
VYVVEQNRDGQVAFLMHAILDGPLSSRLISVRHYDGTPIPSLAVSDPILQRERPGYRKLERNGKGRHHERHSDEDRSRELTAE